MFDELVLKSYLEKEKVIKESFLNYKKRDTKIQKLIFFLFFIITVLILIPIFVIVGLLLFKGISGISIEFLTQAPKLGLKGGGIFPAIVGTFYLVILTAIFSIPLGVLAGVFVYEYLQEDSFLSRVIKISIINLSGVPSIVFGLFGLGVFVLFFKLKVSLLSGALTLTIMVLPVIVSSTIEALKTIPKSFREASFALGATRWQTVKNVVIPNALPGMFTGFILALSRAAGETAPILLTAAAFFLPTLPKSIFSAVMALPYHLYIISTQVPGVSEEVKYGTALVLITLILGVNMISIILRAKIKRAKKW